MCMTDVVVFTTLTHSTLSSVTVFVQHCVMGQHSAIRYYNVTNVRPNISSIINRNQFKSASSFALFIPSALPRLFLQFLLPSAVHKKQI